MWRLVVATFFLWPVLAAAEISSIYDESAEVIRVLGLSSQEQETVLAHPNSVRLQIIENQDMAGMLIDLSQSDDELEIMPRYSLKPSQTYELTINLEGKQAHKQLFQTSDTAVTSPMLLSFSPSQSVIPANTLRFYLQFSEPMARGQVSHAIELVNADKAVVPNPFLNLDVELWDKDQQRLTLILDPGRIKQGVGPNLIGGVPLKKGNRYQLRISKDMKSAKGTAMKEYQTVSFEVSDAERRRINPEQWQILKPQVASLVPLYISFDRIMDKAIVTRLISVEDSGGNPVMGKTSSDGGGWTLTPEKPWAKDAYRIIIDPELEDISGNTIRAPFDAKGGTIGVSETPAILSFTTDSVRRINP